MIKIRREKLSILKCCMAAILILTLISAININVVNADDYYTEGYFKYSDKGNYVSIHSYFGSEKDVVVPAALGGKPVAQIEDYAFIADSNIETIKIPETVINIGDKAYYGLDKLKSVTAGSDNQSEGQAGNQSSDSSGSQAGSQSSDSSESQSELADNRIEYGDEELEVIDGDKDESDKSTGGGSLAGDNGSDISTKNGQSEDGGKSDKFNIFVVAVSVFFAVAIVSSALIIKFKRNGRNGHDKENS